MSKLNNRFWLETEHFVSNLTSTTSPDTPYHDTKSQTRLSRFDIFPKNKMFCNKPTVNSPKVFLMADQTPPNGMRQITS